MSTIADLPNKDEHGRLAHYNPTMGIVPLTRGVLISTSRSQPVPWQRVKESLDTDSPRLNDVSYFVNKTLSRSEIKQIQKDYDMIFYLAFPWKERPAIFVYAGKLNEEQGAYIAFRTEYENISASHIIATATVRKWSALGKRLGRPCYVGLQTSEPFQAIELTDIPVDQKDRFARDLPQFIKSKLDLSYAVELVDLWENQTRAASRSEWKFDGSMLALVRIDDRDGDGVKLGNVVRTWPGWIHWEEEYVIRIDYPGRFNFCEKCKHTAQGFSGLFKRHTEDKCISIVCGLCGHRGHNCKLAATDPNLPSNKRACEEGQEERRRKKARNLEEEERMKADALRLQEKAKKRAAEQEKAQAQSQGEEAQTETVQEETQVDGDDGQEDQAQDDQDETDEAEGIVKPKPEPEE